MSNVIQPLHLLVIALAGWLSRHLKEVIDYLIEENRVLKEQLEGQRLRFTSKITALTMRHSGKRSFVARLCKAGLTA